MAPIKEVEVKFADGSSEWVPVAVAIEKYGFTDLEEQAPPEKQALLSNTGPEVEVKFADGSSEWVPVNEATNKYGYSPETKRDDPSYLKGGAITALNSALFNAGDNLVDLFNEKAGQNIRDDIDAFARNNPKSAVGANVGGAIGGTLIPGVMFAKVASKLPTALKTIKAGIDATGLLGRLGLGVVEAGVQNIADHRTDKNNLGTDLAFGAGGPLVSKVLGITGKNINLGEIPGINDSRSMRWLRQAMDSGVYSAEDLEKASQLVTDSKKFGKPLSLIEALQTLVSPTEAVLPDRLFNKAKMLSQTNDASGKITNEFVANRKVADAIRISDDLNLIHDVGAVGSEVDIRKAIKAGEKAPRIASSPFYDLAYEVAPSLDEKASARLTKLYEKDNIIKTEIDWALKNAVDENNLERVFKIDDSEIVHIAKERLWDKVTKLKPKQKNTARMYEARHKTVKGLLPDAVKDADKIYANVAKTSKPRTELQKQIFKATDNRQLVSQLIGSPEKRAVLSDVMAPENYNELLRRMEIENRIFQGNNYLFSNSDTARNAMSIKDIFGAGNTKENIGQYLQSKFMGSLDDEFAMETTKNLFSTGDKALTVLDDLNDYVKANKLGKDVDENALKIARSLLRGF